MLEKDFFKKKMDYERLCFEVEKINKKSNYFEVFTIGKSWENKDIICLRIGKGSKKVLYVGAHHGLEWGTSSVLIAFVNEFLNSIKNKKKFHGYDYNLLLNKITFYIIPMLNPDGVNLSLNGLSKDSIFYNDLLKHNNDFSKWQANIRGVDLNHNYDFEFETGKKLEEENGILGPCKTKYSGETFESENETKALCKFTRFIKPKLIIALHSQGKEIYCEYKNKSLNEKNIEIILSKLTGYKSIILDGYVSCGGFKDWAVKELNCFGCTIEMGEGVNPLDYNQLISAYDDIKEALICAPLLFKDE